MMPRFGAISLALSCPSDFTVVLRSQAKVRTRTCRRSDRAIARVPSFKLARALLNSQMEKRVYFPAF